MNNRREALCKKLRRQAVEGRLLEAIRSPRAFGKMLQARGYYAPEDRAEVLESHVNKVIARIEREGRKYPCVDLDDLPILEYPQEKQSRKTVAEVVGAGKLGFFTAEIPARADAVFTKKERHQMYEMLFNIRGEPKWIFGQVAKILGRTPKSIKRQFQGMLYNERTKDAVTYVPDREYRQERTAENLNVLACELIRKNPIHRVALRFTSRLLCFWDQKELLRAQRRLNHVRKMRR